MNKWEQIPNNGYKTIETMPLLYANYFGIVAASLLGI